VCVPVLFWHWFRWRERKDGRCWLWGDCVGEYVGFQGGRRVLRVESLSFCGIGNGGCVSGLCIGLFRGCPGWGGFDGDGGGGRSIARIGVRD
jgi:hypothetical protein